MPTQLGAVTGRRAKPRYREMIEAQLPYLYPMRELEQQKAYQEATLGLERRGLTLQEKEMAQREKELAEWEALKQEKLEEARKQARIGNIFAGGNIALTTGIGLYGAMRRPTTPTPAASAATGSPSAPLTATKGMGLRSVSGMPTGTAATPSGGLIDWSRLGSTAMSPTTWAGGGLGTIAGRVFGKEDRTKRSLIGAGVGALAGGIMSGADPYTTVVSGILGGLGGLI